MVQRDCAALANSINRLILEFVNQYHILFITINFEDECFCDPAGVLKYKQQQQQFTSHTGPVWI